MIICCACNTEKEESEFNKRTRRDRVEFQSRCRLCQSVYSKKHYADNKPEYIAKSARNSRVIRDAISALKNNPCTDCGGVFPPCVMDFDHLGDKKFNLSQASQFSAEAVTAELKKCELVCANCHRIRTHKK